MILKALAALIALLCVPLVVLPLLIVAIAAGPVVVTLLFITGCGGFALALGGALLGAVLSVRVLWATLTAPVRHAGRSARTR